MGSEFGQLLPRKTKLDQIGPFGPILFVKVGRISASGVRCWQLLDNFGAASQLATRVGATFRGARRATRGWLDDVSHNRPFRCSRHHRMSPSMDPLRWELGRVSSGKLCRRGRLAKGPLGSGEDPPECRSDTRAHALRRKVAPLTGSVFLWAKISRPGVVTYPLPQAGRLPQTCPTPYFCELLPQETYDLSGGLALDPPPPSYMISAEGLQQFTEGGGGVLRKPPPNFVKVCPHPRIKITFV